MKKIIIDPGHGGSDSGAIGFGVMEKDWTLKMSLYQYERLKELGAQVALTRVSDQTLAPYNRVAKVKNHYDICLSNHFNAFNGSARGVEVIHSYLAQPTIARKLAEAIVNASGLPLRRVFSRKTPNGRSDYYFMHRLTGSTRTLIIEYGFIDNKADNDFYSQDANFYRVGEAVVKAVCQEIGLKYVPVNNFKVQVGRGRESEIGVKTDSDKGSPKANDVKQNVDNNRLQPDAKSRNFVGKRIVSIHPGKLRFYKSPSWRDGDVYGYLTKGQGFSKVLDQVRVGRGYQYKVANAKGETYYITASPKYVRLK